MGIVAKYKYNGSIYPDLIPEFNTEFIDYTITDEGNIIRDIEWEIGDIDTASGNPRDNITDHRRSDFIEILPNVCYMSAKPTHVGWYDSDKNYIGYNMWVSEYANTGLSASPSNARYAKFWHGEIYNDGFAVAAGEITRTIESNSLPTLMRFGVISLDGSITTEGTNREKSLLEILEMDTSNLLTMNRMFGYCHNLTSITCNWNTSKVTDMFDVFCRCHNLSILDVAYWDVSNVTKLQGLFYICHGLKSLDLSRWKISNSLQTIAYIFTDCNSLSTLDISNINIPENVIITGLLGDNNISLKYIKCNIPTTIQIISSLLPTRASDNKGVIIYQGEETLSSETISTLSSKNWTVVSEVELIAEYKYDSKIYKNLIPVFNDGYMGFVEDEEVDENGIVTRVIEHVELPTLMRFSTCQPNGQGLDGREKALLELLHINTSNLTTEAQMFQSCINLTYVNTENMINLHQTHHMFCGCSSLTSLDVSKFDTSNVTRMDYMFYDCNKLTSLDVSNFDTRKVIRIECVFHTCTNLTSLDVSNFDTSKVTTVIGMFDGTLLLTDIGMIYCNKETVNKVASLLPTDVHRTIWVGEHDLSQYDQYDHITYKTQIVEEEVILNSPLLEGDRIEVVDGKLCHYHKMGMVVLDENYKGYIGLSGTLSDTIRFYITVDKPKENTHIVSNNFKSNIGYSTDNEHGYASASEVYIFIKKDKLSTLDVNGFKQWLSENPTTVIYELANPYYEVLQDKPLSLTLVSEEDNDISNSSNIPTNMIVDNRPLPTIGMGGSKEYTIAFDKSDEESSVVVNLCGSSIETTDNIVHITTPSTIENNELTILGNGEEISNVRILEGNVVDKGIPKESFEGLKNSFEDGYIPTSCLDTSSIATPENEYFSVSFSNNTLEYISASSYTDAMHPANLMTLPGLVQGKKYTLVFISNATFNMTISYSSSEHPSDIHHVTEGGWVLVKKGLNKLVFTMWDYPKAMFRLCDNPENCRHFILSNFAILEGDWTHLTEEDFNHLGQYKVEYKVTGKNKAGDITPANGNSNDQHWIVTDNNNGTYTVKGDGYTGSSVGFALKLHANVKPNTTYTFSYKVDGVDWNKGTPIFLYRDFYSLWNKTKFMMASQLTSTITFTTPSDVDKICIGFHYSSLSDTTERIISDIQLEEGTQVTSYEPYKEQIKTFYLNSPLLEGDTIEDVNGVATHVHRKKEIKLSSDVYTNFHSNEELDIYNIQLVRIFDSIELKGEDVYRGQVTLPNPKDSLITEKANEIIRDGTNKFSENDIYLTPDGHIWLAINNKMTSVSKEYIETNVGRILARLSTPWNEPLGAYGKVVLDGSEEGWVLGASGTSERIEMYNANILPKTSGNKNITSDYFCDRLPIRQETQTNEYVVISPLTKGIAVILPTTKATDLAQGKQWLKENPLTIIYKLAEPEYQGSILCDSYVNGHLDLDSDIPVERVQFREVAIQQRYLQPNTTYTVQFESDNVGKLESEWLGSGVYPSRNIVKGINKFQVTTDDTITHTYLGLEGIGFNASNIQVVQTDEDIDFGYFKGLSSSFESELVTDENDEYYGKYKVECKVEGKNKFDGVWERGTISSEDGALINVSDEIRTVNYIEINPNISYILTKYDDLHWLIGVRYYDKDYNYIGYNDNMKNPSTILSIPPNAKYVKFKTYSDTLDLNVQLEEGTQATPYEPYKSYTKTFYLNSPLLQGDTIEEVNGKMCHVHRSEKFIFDGSLSIQNLSNCYDGENTYYNYVVPVKDTIYLKPTNNNQVSDKLPKENPYNNIEAFWILVQGNNMEFRLKIKNLATVDEYNQYLQANPITAIYELAEPWYEPIEPEQQNLTITSIKDADLHIDTVVPISSTVTYNVNVKLLTDFEESIISQVQNANEVNLLSILDEEIDN